MVLKEINLYDDYINLKRLSIHGPVFLLKHSITCPKSAKVFDIFSRFDDTYEEVPCFILRIQEHRQVSDKISVDTSIEHESPQVIVFMKGKVVATEHHEKITMGWLENELQKIAPHYFHQTEISEFETEENAQSEEDKQEEEGRELEEKREEEE